VQEVLYVSASSLSNKQESELDGNHLIVLCTLSNYDLRIDTHALIDCGCTGYSFMNDEFTCQYNLLKRNMYVACVACRIKVLGYMEDLQSSYIFAEFLYLYQSTLHPSPNTPLISTGYKPSRVTTLYLPLI
jgi:hypothetical protein